MSEKEEHVFESDRIADFQRERLVQEIEEHARKRRTGLIGFWVSLSWFVVTVIYFFHRVHEIRIKPRAGGLADFAVLAEVGQLLGLTVLGLIVSIILCVSAMFNFRPAIYLLVVEVAALLLLLGMSSLG